MRNSFKIIIPLIVLAVLGVLVVVGYRTYLSQKAQVSKFPYTTTVTPEPTKAPTGEISVPDTIQAIEAELNATTISDLESELKSLEQEAVGL